MRTERGVRREGDPCQAVTGSWATLSLWIKCEPGNLPNGLNHPLKDTSRLPVKEAALLLRR